MTISICSRIKVIWAGERTPQPLFVNLTLNEHISSMSGEVNVWHAIQLEFILMLSNLLIDA